MNTMPVVTYAFSRPYCEELERQHVDVEPVLRAVGLQPDKLDDDATYIPAQAWYDLTDRVAEVLNEQTLGYRIGSEAAIDTLPNLRVLELQHATLGELLTALVIDVRSFSTIASYTLSTDGEIASLVTKRNFNPKTPPAQIDGYFAGFMVRILALCLGDQWAPEELKIGVCQPNALPSRTRTACRVNRIGLEGASFMFPARWLLQRTDGVLRQSGLRTEGLGNSFLDEFGAMLELHLDTQQLTLERFSALTNQSVSTLKRRLQRSGTTYQRELDKRRSSRAKLLLQGTGQTIAQVGDAVGYPDPPSFTRVFKRWASQTPLDFRASEKAKNEVV